MFVRMLRMIWHGGMRVEAFVVFTEDEWLMALRGCI